MKGHFVTVSVFCLLCATHSPCESHSTTTRTSSENVHRLKGLPNDRNGVPIVQPVERSPHTRKPPNYLNESDRLITIGPRYKKRDVDSESAKKLDNHYLHKLFAMFGDGTTMTIDGFEKLMQHLDSKKVLSPPVSLQNDEPIMNKTNENDTCLLSNELQSSLFPNLQNKISIDDNKLLEVCPAILFGILSGTCESETQATLHSVNDSSANDPAATQHNIWLYSTLAIVTISACGILGLAIIPLMQKKFYQPLLQFLVALAVGTLAGDALLHLLPHAMSTHDHHHHHRGQEESDSHSDNMWKGFVAMMGLIFFFVMESALNFCSEWRKSRQRKDKVPRRVVVVRDSESNLASASDDHNHKNTPYCNYCVCEKIAARVKEGPSKHNGMFEGSFWRSDGGNEANNCGQDSEQEFMHDELCQFHKNKLETNQNHTECPSQSRANKCSNVNKMVPIDIAPADAVPEEYTVILREHETKHHGHSHKHGHVHSAPSSLSSVAWMVIMGDGLHNFTDGMAIGAAFAGGIAGGFSTTVAVFCHELPHEIGDFAVLLKAGMSMKQALFYNLLSSILCLVGNVIGVLLGHSEMASRWVFAAAAGMFLYIALVDMIPELSSGHNAMGSLFQPLLQVLGLLCGLCIMAVIALYEHDLKNIFHDHDYH